MDVRGTMNKFRRPGQPGAGSFAFRIGGKEAGALLLTLAAALALWLYLAATYRKAAVDEIYKTLQTINSYKTAQAAEWLEEHTREAVRLSHHPIFGKIIYEEIKTPGSRRPELAAWLKEHLILNEYTSLAFLTAKGAVLAKTPGYGSENAQTFAEAFERASQKGTALVSGIYLAADGRPRLGMFIPLSLHGIRGEKTIGVLVINIDPAKELYPLLKGGPHFYSEIETILVRKEKGTVLYLSGAERLGNAPLRFSRPLTETALPAAAAARGETGIFAGVNSRGTKVFSAINSVPGSDWALITQIDRKEILAPVKTKERLALVLIVLTVLVFYSIFLMVLRYREEAGMRIIQEGADIFREFMEHSPVYVFFKDAEIRTVRLSRNYEAMLGKPLEELLGKTMDDLFPSDLAKRMIADDKRILAEGKEAVVEEEFNGRNYKTVKFPILVDNKPRYLAGFTQDITEAKKAADSLRESEARFKQLFETMAEGFATHEIICDKQGRPVDYRFIDANPAFELLTGLKKADIAGRTVLEVLPATEKTWIENYGRVALSGEPIHFENYSAALGKWYAVTAFSPAKGQFAVSFFDISKRKQAELALQETGTRLKEAQNLARIGSYVLDVNTGNWTSSAALNDIFGIGEDYQRSVEGWINLIHPGDRIMMETYFREEVLARGQAFNKEYRLRPRDTGEERWVHGLGRLELDAKQAPVKMIGTIQDITESKLAQIELEKVNRDLTDKKLEMENFLYITTHDLRTPLVNIQGFSQKLEGHITELSEAMAPAPLPGDIRDIVNKLTGESIPAALKFIEEGAHNMDTLISALLKVSRIGRVEIKPESIEMNELLAKLKDDMSFSLEQAGGTIKCGLLPPCMADLITVSQLFANLLDNAVKYRHKDRPPAISVAGEVKGGMAAYTVADNGAGIPEKELPGIWNLFLSRRAPGKKGEGIGLPSARRIAERNGGKIKAESKEGEGTVFTVTLPAAVTGDKWERTKAA